MKKLITFTFLLLVFILFPKVLKAQTAFEQSNYGISYMNVAGGFHFYGTTEGAFEVLANEEFITINFSDGTLIAFNPEEEYMLSFNDTINELEVTEFSNHDDLYVSAKAQLILQEYNQHLDSIGSGKDDCPSNPMPGESCGPIEIYSHNSFASPQALKDSFNTTDSSAYCESVKNNVKKPYGGHSSLLGCTISARMSFVLSSVIATGSCGAVAYSGGLFGFACVAALADLGLEAVALENMDQACKVSYNETKQNAKLCEEEMKEPRNSSGYKDIHAQVSGGVPINFIWQTDLLKCIKGGTVTITDLAQQVTSTNNSGECSNDD